MTFYSYKGGVGRSLALANTAYELAQTGRVVLVFDFVLEAPGLHTFEAFRPRATQKREGLVDYIREFCVTRSEPDVRNYVYEAIGVGQEEGRLWVMPAGKGGGEYARSLNMIDWQDLYEKEDGFLMMEDLRVQWKAAFEPDYVLIDSRTGYTDIGGICTRQLPDAVVILFFPNEQNLEGLKTVVSEIRSEKTNGAGVERDIRLRFVMSNVPSLDDEHGILAAMEKRFAEQLGYEALSAIIHKYDSLALLKQGLFVAERPNTLLAKEYRDLTTQIVEGNLEDREGVIQTLRDRWRSRVLVGRKDYDDKIVPQIMKHHGHDGELLYYLSNALGRSGKRKVAETVLGRSIELGYENPRALLDHASLGVREGETEVALAEVFQVLGNPDLDESLLGRTIEIVRLIDRKKLLDIVDTPAFSTLTFRQCILVVNELIFCEEGLRASVDLLKRVCENGDLRVQEMKTLEGWLGMCLTGLSQCEEALKLFGTSRPVPSDLGTNDAFNYAMAEWGGLKKLPRDMFERVIELDSPEKRQRSCANYAQCLAVSLWATEKTDEALECVELAESKIREQVTDFSCWRYMSVTPHDFLKDCECIRRLIKGEQVTPPFFAGKTMQTGKNS